MEIYQIFLWLQISTAAVQVGFIIGGLLKKDINLSVVYVCMFLVLTFMVGVLIYKP